MLTVKLARFKYQHWQDNREARHVQHQRSIAPVPKPAETEEMTQQRRPRERLDELDLEEVWRITLQNREFHCST